MRICIVQGCKMRQKPVNIKFHKFPEDAGLTEKWKANMGINDQSFNEKRTNIICGLHFGKEDYRAGIFSSK